MVGEHQVRATALDVKASPSSVERDRGALDVPAGPARPERRRPGWLARTRRLPEQAVERVLLARAVGVAAAVGEHAPASASSEYCETVPKRPSAWTEK